MSVETEDRTKIIQLYGQDILYTCVVVYYIRIRVNVIRTCHKKKRRGGGGGAVKKHIYLISYEKHDDIYSYII